MVLNASGELYNGRAKKHFLDYAKAKETEHEVILYCEANP
jgi:hypothetical protein